MPRIGSLLHGGEAPARRVRALGRELELAGESRVALGQAETWIERAAAGERCPWQ